MDANTISAIAEVIEALPEGPYFTFETPVPALEQIAGRDINLGSTFGDTNLPFGEDAIDVHTEETDDNSTHVSDIVDVNAGTASPPNCPRASIRPARPVRAGGNSVQAAALSASPRGRFCRNIVAPPVYPRPDFTEAPPRFRWPRFRRSAVTTALPFRRSTA